MEIVIPHMRTPYNFNTAQNSAETATKNNEPTMTNQAFKDEVDLNVIMARYIGTGVVPQNITRIPLPPEQLIEPMDYQTALHYVMEVHDAFEQLPASVRARFQNNPQEIMQFIENPANREEAIRIGLIDAPPLASQNPPKSEEKTTA